VTAVPPEVDVLQGQVLQAVTPTLTELIPKAQAAPGHPVIMIAVIEDPVGGG